MIGDIVRWLESVLKEGVVTVWQFVYGQRKNFKFSVKVVRRDSNQTSRIQIRNFAHWDEVVGTRERNYVWGNHEVHCEEDVTPCSRVQNYKDISKNILCPSSGSKTKPSKATTKKLAANLVFPSSWLIVWLTLSFWIWRQYNSPIRP
jgi:hypothetical protein